MGYSYDMRGRLACDACGHVGGTRKRRCRFTVLVSSLRTAPPTRYRLPYCPAPALCSVCYKRERATLHGDRCRAGAAASQARYDVEQAALDRGEYIRTTCYGDWHAAVPKGFVGALFTNIRGEEVGLLLPESVYETGGMYFSELADRDFVRWHEGQVPVPA